MGRNLENMKKAIATGRKKNGEPPAPPPVCAMPIDKKGPTPAERDREMEKGRWPTGTKIECTYSTFAWSIYLYVPPKTMGIDACYEDVGEGSGLHELLSQLYKRWTEAGKPGATFIPQSK